MNTKRILAGTGMAVVWALLGLLGGASIAIAARALSSLFVTMLN